MGRVAARDALEAASVSERLGRWPAVAGILGFAWLELIYTNTDRPSVARPAGVVYAAVQLLGMALYGVETWTTRVTRSRSTSTSSPAVAASRARRAVILAPAARRAPVWPGCCRGGSRCSAADDRLDELRRARAGPLWSTRINPDLRASSPASALGSDGRRASWAAPSACSRCVRDRRLLLPARHPRDADVGPATPPRELAGRFAHTLVPIAFAYVVAHYFSLLVYQGQAMSYLISDPLGHGSNIFGTATRTINYNVISRRGSGTCRSAR